MLAMLAYRGRLRFLCDPYEEADDPEGWGVCYYDCEMESIDCHVDCL
jgi:hypothetical protein